MVIWGLNVSWWGLDEEPGATVGIVWGGEGILRAHTRPTTQNPLCTPGTPVHPENRLEMGGQGG